MSSRQLNETLVDFAWNEWAQMGLLATPRTRSPWAQDPEALIVFTLEVARDEPRLFDELLDWMLTNAPLFSVRRMRAVCIDETDRALVAAALGWLAHQRPQARLRPAVPSAAEAQPLFRFPMPTTKADADFAAAGFLRPPLRASHKSRAPDVDAPINLAFRLRQIVGVGIRAEVLRVLLTSRAPWMTAQAIAQSIAYAKRNVHEALLGLQTARVLSAFTVSGEQRYSIDRQRWVVLLGITDELPSYRSWPQLLGALRLVSRWYQAPERTSESAYIRSSRTRDLLDQIRPLLAFAGIAVSSGSLPDSAQGDLDSTVERALASIYSSALGRDNA